MNEGFKNFQYKKFLCKSEVYSWTLHRSWCGNKTYDRFDVRLPSTVFTDNARRRQAVRFRCFVYSLTAAKNVHAQGAEINNSNMVKQNKKSNFYNTPGITPKRVTRGGAHLRDLVPERHSSEETFQRWRNVGDTLSDLTGPAIEPQNHQHCSECPD